MATIRPIKHKVIVEIIDENSSEGEWSSGGIWMPNITKTRNFRGIVKGIGDDISLDIKQNDTVIFSMYEEGRQEKTFSFDGKKFLALNEPDIIAVIEDDGRI